MPIEVILEILPEEAASDEIIKMHACRKAGVSSSDVRTVQIIKRSIDARRHPVKYRLVVHLHTETVLEQSFAAIGNDVGDAEPVYIAGMGPAGMFAALECITLGMKPIIIERGKEIRARRRDLAKLTKEHIVNPDSNYCFGEGGAGTYSDGKLYTRSHKRGDIQNILEQLVAFGASTDILIDAHPHIGTNKLPGIIESMREHILDCGGQILFNTRLESLETANGILTGIRLSDRTLHKASTLILATGHSARDIFTMLHQQGILIEVKPFALGVRVEHPQQLVDRIQYHCDVRDVNLPPSSYSLVNQYQNRGTFSFCMCPGGIIAPCATAPGEIVTNGWSPSKRDNFWANSGIVTEVKPQDFAKAGFTGPLAGMQFQMMIEQAAFREGGGGQVAPAQRIDDFIAGKLSASLPDSSYLPGIKSTDLKKVLPSFIHESLRIAFKTFGKKMPGFVSEHGVVHAPESRSSSPVRIPRDRETCMHPQIKGLFPCGEGAGYAGGIVSAAMDGQRVVRALIATYPRS